MPKLDKLDALLGGSEARIGLPPKGRDLAGGQEAKLEAFKTVLNRMAREPISDELISKVIGGIALGPLGPARARPPGMLLDLRKLAKSIVEKLGLPKDIRAFAGGGMVRGFGRKKAGFAGSEAARPDVDLIFGVPKEAIPKLGVATEKGLSFGTPKALTLTQIEGKLNRLLEQGAKTPETKKKFQEVLDDLQNELTLMFGTARSGSRFAPEVKGAPVDLLVEMIENVGKGFTGFDPVIELPLRAAGLKATTKAIRRGKRGR